VQHYTIWPRHRHLARHRKLVIFKEAVADD